jgi:uncharacterized protein (DUF2384 family)
MLGVSARTMRELEADRVKMSAIVERRLIDTQRVHDALASLMVAEDIAAWLETPNPLLDGREPIELVKRGELEQMWGLVYALSTGDPSA